VLLVYITFHQDALDRQKIEVIVDKAMKGHERLCHDTGSQAQRILEVCLRVSRLSNSLLTKSQESRDIASGVWQGESLNVPNPPSPSFQIPPPATTRPFPHEAQPFFQDPSYFPTDAVFDNDIFRDLYEVGTFGDGSGLDIIMNAGFDE
jgi:hypothetical protein